MTKVESRRRSYRRYGDTQNCRNPKELSALMLPLFERDLEPENPYRARYEILKRLTEPKHVGTDVTPTHSGLRADVSVLKASTA